MRTRTARWWGLLLAFWASWAWSAVVTVDHDTRHLSLGASSDVLIDSSGDLGIRDVLEPRWRGAFKPAGRDVVNLGFTAARLWHRLTLSNRSDRPLRFYLDVDDGLVTWVDAYLSVDGRVLSERSSGAGVPYRDRPVPVRSQAFPIEVPAGAHVDLHVRVGSYLPIMAPLDLWAPEAFIERATQAVLWQSLYFGIVLAMVIYNLFLCLSLRESVYMLYVAFLVGVGAAFFVFSGFAGQYLFPELPQLSWSMIGTLLPAVQVFAVAFALQFFGHAEGFAPYRRWLNTLLILGMGLVICNVALPARWGIPLGVLFIAISGISVVAAAFFAWRRGFEPGKYYLISWAMLAAGVTLLALMSFGVLPRNFFTYNSLQIASAAEALLLAFALAARMRVLRNEKEEALRQVTRQDKMAALGLMSAGVAHEINNPNQFMRVSAQNVAEELTKFRGFLLDMLESDDDELRAEFDRRFDRMSQHLGLIEEGSQRIRDIVQSMRSASRSDAGDMQDIDPQHAVDSALKLVRVTHRGPQEFTVDVRSTARVRGRLSELCQVFLNLMVNASHAVEERGKKEGRDYAGSISIIVDCHEGEWSASVIDNGTGMSEETRRRLFEPFFTTKGSDTGTGLGMSICKRIVEHHQGRLEVESTPGSGTCMRVVLPIVDLPLAS